MPSTSPAEYEKNTNPLPLEGEGVGVGGTLGFPLTSILSSGGRGGIFYVISITKIQQSKVLNGMIRIYFLDMGAWNLESVLPVAFTRLKYSTNARATSLDRMRTDASWLLLRA